MNVSGIILKRLPKVELHCHLDGSLRPQTMVSLAQKDGISLPTNNVPDLKKMLSIGKDQVSLEEYINRFQITLSVLQTPESLERTAFELIEDVADEIDEQTDELQDEESEGK